MDDGFRTHLWIQRIRRLWVLVAAPPLVGLAILVAVFLGLGSNAILTSGAATSVALIVATALILIPPIVYALAPDEYDEHLADIERRMGAAAELVNDLLAERRALQEMRVRRGVED